MAYHWTYKFATYSSDYEFNALQEKYSHAEPLWRVHSWKVNEGDGSITVLWENVVESEVLEDDEH